MAGAKEREKRLLQQMIATIFKFPLTLYQLIMDKANTLMYTAQALDTPRLIAITPVTIRRLEQSWKLQLEQADKQALLTAEEKQLVSRINDFTKLTNRNNVTRTQAYWQCYQMHPELHWALLAHIVSRNGGWCMTDLRGDLLPQLLSEGQTKHLFAFLERANGLIFQDAYPQLLLYRESVKRKRSMFHLLPYFGVSSFMEPVWRDFWKHKQSAALTISLIINEQNYIEKRIVQNNHYKQAVLDTFIFKTQAWLQLNQVVIPYFNPMAQALPFIRIRA